MSKTIIAVTFFAACCSASAVQAAESPADFPVKPIRMVVGFAPGGGVDIVARQIGPRLSQVIGQTIIIDNHPGAGGAIGAAVTSNSAPDGYTVLAISSSYAVIPSMTADLSFDPVKDLTGVSLMVEAPLLVLVHPSLPVHSVKELIALARAKPGQLDFASGGEGTSGHLAGEMFNRMAKVNMVHVPYKGAGQAMIDVISGQVQLEFAGMLSSMPQVKSGALRAIAVTSKQRSTVVPQLPTVAELVPGYDRTTWYGVLAPSRTPSEIVNKLSQAIAKSLAFPEMKQRFAGDGGEIKGGTPKQMQDYVVSEINVSKSIIQKTGVRK